MQVQLEPATHEDAEAIHQLQVASFLPLLRQYQDRETNPANDTVDRIKTRLAQPSTTYFFIVVDNARIGAIRVVYDPQTRHARISPIFIVPSHQGKGYGQAAMRLIEERVDADLWTLDTILQEKGHCYLYEKLGYRRTGTTRVVNDRMTIISYEKHRH